MADGRKKVLSYGGGLNSWAMLIGAGERGEHLDHVVFCDVGDSERKTPGEWPATYKHMREIVVPYCDAHGIPFAWLDMDSYPIRRGKKDETSAGLFGYFEAKGQIPVSGPNRLCTRIAKVERFENWMDDTYPGEDVEVWIGFDAGEPDRVAKDPNAGDGRPATATTAGRHNRFPLVEWGWCRCLCEAAAVRTGLPIPRKSACMGCPYNSAKDWKALAEEAPETFAWMESLERNKLPTKTGYKLTIHGWSNWKVSSAAYRALKAMGAGESVKSSPTTRSMAKRHWVEETADGYRLTSWGREIADHVREEHVDKVPIADFIPSKPVSGIHYDGPALAEVLKKKTESELGGCDICGAARKATKSTGCSYLGDAERVIPAGSLVRPKAA
jgi:hypothetical protein